MIKKIPKRIRNNKIIYISIIILLLLLSGIIFFNKINHNVEEKHNQDITKYYFKDSKYNVTLIYNNSLTYSLTIKNNNGLEFRIS